MTAVDSSLPADADRAAPAARIVRPGEGNRIRAFGNEIEFMLSGAQTADSLTVGMASVPVGNGPPPHVHYSEDEMFLIVEGEYRIYLNGDWTTVGPGTVVYLPRGSVHTFQVTGDKPGRHWTLQTPSGFERYSAQAAEIFSAPGKPDFARLDAITKEYGAEFVKPTL